MTWSRHAVVGCLVGWAVAAAPNVGDRVASAQETLRAKLIGQWRLVSTEQVREGRAGHAGRHGHLAARPHHLHRRRAHAGATGAIVAAEGARRRRLARPGEGAAAHAHQLFRDLHGGRADPHGDPSPRRQPGARRARLRADHRPVGPAPHADHADHRRRRQEAVRADYVGTGRAGASGGAVPGLGTAGRRRHVGARRAQDDDGQRRGAPGPSVRIRKACSSSARTATPRWTSSTRSARRPPSTPRRTTSCGAGRHLPRLLRHLRRRSGDEENRRPHHVRLEPDEHGVDQIRYYEIDGDLL